MTGMAQMTMRRLAFCVYLSVVAMAGGAQAVIIPTPIATDNRIKTVMYSPNEVIKFTGYYRYQTSIEFATDEEIATITLGDSVPWQINPIGNRLFIKPIEQDATTNMTVITNKHTYFFELHSADATSISDKNLTFALRFIYPGDDSNMNIQSLDHVPDLEQEDLSKYNFRYSITGSEEISPIRIFDDGEFTYFQFHDVNANIPAFFQVDSEGNESLINFRTRGAYIVVERVAAKYTLRHGNSVVCVFNDAKNPKKPAKKASASGYADQPGYTAPSSHAAPVGNATFQR